MALPRSIQRITVLGADGEPMDVFRRKRRKRKSSLPLAPGETLVRRVTEGVRRTAETYLSEHRDSNREAKDGWLTELGPNVFKASRKGLARMVRGRGE